MTLVKSIDGVVEWLRKNVCSQITLKLPNDDDNGDNGVKYVNPAAFPLYVPGKDRLPPSVLAPIPSVCVQLMEGSDDLLQKKRQFQIRLCLACWNPGIHGSEILHKKELPLVGTAIVGKAIVAPDNSKNPLGNYSYYQVTETTEETYARNMEGWRDLYNFKDIVLRELEGTEYIAGLRLVKETSIKYGPFVEDGNIWDYYPYWHSWITFTLESGVVARTPEIYNDFL